ncbi:MAG: hypothetical protein JNL82_19845 [Myxococcales bacterium]|nr:hypothetical protein [Myxococcales bacterium]
MKSSIHHILLSVLLVSSAAGCKTTVKSATEAPALGADATIVAKKNKTGVYGVSIEVINLAPAPRLDAESTNYVVWLVTKNAPAVRAGALSYDEDDRRGVLEATCPSAQFNVMVTLEKDANPASPSGKGILNVAIAAR